MDISYALAHVFTCGDSVAFSTSSVLYSTRRNRVCSIPVNGTKIALEAQMTTQA